MGWWAFGKHRDCGEDKYRQVQILVIHNDSKFEVRRKPFNSERHPTSNMGMKVKKVHSLTLLLLPLFSLWM